MTHSIDTSKMTPAEIRRAAYRAIVNELGPSGLLRFVQDYYPGTGDYTKERHDFLPKGTVRDVARQVSSWKEDRNKS